MFPSPCFRIEEVLVSPLTFAGTGKTVISALDYKRFCKQNAGHPCRLLFVAHREEILKQSMHTFRAVLKDANFGEMFVGSYRPDRLDHLFISIQTFNSQDFTTKTTPDFYDFVIVDEFHHAAAPTYQKLLEYYQPRILLGLTATPERMDGKSVLGYFNNRIATEIRLPEAIDRGVTGDGSPSHPKRIVPCHFDNALCQEETDKKHYKLILL